MTDCQSSRHGPVGLADGSVEFRVWAPRAASVELVLIDSGTRHAHAMTREEHGYFRHTVSHLAEGRRYAYRLDGGPERPDPASCWQPDGVHQPSAIFYPGRCRWTDRAWAGVRREDLVFYELHVGTFTAAGTFEAVLPRLSSLRRLGVTALELMPVAQFPGTRNWGYDGVHPYAVQNSYGGPHGLQRLVDACHAAGLAVFLDVVYNHLGPEGNYLNEFGPYFTERHQTPWGPAVNYDGPGSDPVRDFVLENARMWVEDFHLDGLRLDAVHAICDGSARHILQEIGEVAAAAGARLGRTTRVIAESDLNDPRLLRPAERGGCGLDAQWSDDFHHAVHTVLTGECQGYYADFGRPEQLARVLREPFLYAGQYSAYRDRKHGAPAGDLPGDRFVVSVQNHDQVGNRARGDRFGTLLAPPARRLAASLLLLSPHLPLLFMGEEYGEPNPFPFFCSFGDVELIGNVRAGRAREFAAFAWQGEVPDPQDEATFAAARLSWSWPAGTDRAGLRRLYADLLTARREWPALRNWEQRDSRLVTGGAQPALLELVRLEGADPAGPAVRAYFNLSGRPARLPADPAPAGRLLFSSEWPAYAGGRDPVEAIQELLPHECIVFGPAGYRRLT